MSNKYRLNEQTLQDFIDLYETKSLTSERESEVELKRFPTSDADLLRIKNQR